MRWRKVHREGSHVTISRDRLSLFSEFIQSHTGLTFTERTLLSDEFARWARGHLNDRRRRMA